jgi:hypothetical protein
VLLCAEAHCIQAAAVILVTYTNVHRLKQFGCRWHMLSMRGAA